MGVLFLHARVKTTLAPSVILRVGVQRETLVSGLSVDAVSLVLENIGELFAEEPVERLHVFQIWGLTNYYIFNSYFINSSLTNRDVYY